MNISFEQLQPDYEKAHQFLNILAPGVSDFTFQSFDDNQIRKEASLNKTLHGSLYEHWNSLVDLNRRGACIAVTVQQTDLLGRKKDNIIGLRAVFIEDDDDKVPKLPLEPHMIVQSSEGKFHYYFLITDGSGVIDEFSSVQQRLACDFGSDPAAIDLPRTLRLPGFFHLKINPNKSLQANPQIVEIIQIGKHSRYTWDEIKQEFPPVSRRTIKPNSRLKPKSTIEDIETILNEIDPDVNYEQWLKVLMAIHHETGGLQSGLDLAIKWSSKGEKFITGDAEKRWESFYGYDDEPVTIGTLRHLADDRSMKDHAIAIKVFGNNPIPSKQQLNLATKWIKAANANEVEEKWLYYANGMQASDLDMLKRLVRDKTSIGLRVLNAEIKEQALEKKENDAKRALELEKAERQTKGLLHIDYAEDQLNTVVKSVKDHVLSHTVPGHIFVYGKRLTKINIGQPNSVRQIQKKSSEGDNYPNQYITFEFTMVTCQMRIRESVSFSAGKKFILCPLKVAQALMDDPSFAKPLSGLLEAPSVMPKTGRLFNKPGYDNDTGFYGVFDARLAENIPSHPTKIDALRSLKYINDVVFAGFPFGSDGDKVTAVAFLLTAFIRRFINKAPGFMVNATTQSSGKSTLVDVVFQAAYGRPAAAASWTDNQEEMQKHILAILLEGQSGICFDNLPFGSRVDGDELAKLLTQELYQARILGKNTSATVPTNILVALTGNQLSAMNDMTTRLLPINLVPDVECPENRVFNRSNIDAWHEDNRMYIVTAVCTILLAYHQSSENMDITPSRFVDWDDAVRKPLAWLGASDVMAQFEVNRAEDPVRELRGRFLDEWHKVYGDKWVELKMIADQWPLAVFGSEFATLHELFSGQPTPQQIGAKVRYFKDTIINGLKLTQQELPVGSKSKASRPWRVVRVDRK